MAMDQVILVESQERLHHPLILVRHMGIPETKKNVSSRKLPM